MRKISKTGAALLVLVLVEPALRVPQAQAATELEVNKNGVTVKVRTRAASQIAAFYEARGFPGKALELLAQHCFMTVTIRNRSQQVIWLQPERWLIQRGTKTQPPLGEGYWQQQWPKIDLSPAKKSTFRWTQLPKIRDLQPNEPVGGNIAIPRKSGQFSLTAVFATGQNRLQGDIRARFQGLSCSDG